LKAEVPCRIVIMMREKTADTIVRDVWVVVSREVTVDVNRCVDARIRREGTLDRNERY
jgi:hypothetical protein